MKGEILDRLEALVNSDSILQAQKEFKSLSAQFKSLLAHGITHIDESAGGANTSPKEARPGAASQDGAQPATEGHKEQANVSGAVEGTDLPKGEPTENTEDLSAAPKAHLPKGENTENEPGKEDAAGAIWPEAASESLTGDAPAQSEAEASAHTSAAEEELAEARRRFKELNAAFKDKLRAAQEAKAAEEKRTVQQAQKLLEELRTLVENEEHIGKAFSSFNLIREQWKALPKVSNDAYRDLNVEYNKLNELFFYNITIYKELKEYDFKHNLEQKKDIVARQIKLLEEKDIRILEVEVRLNQDAWNEIGPTFKEEWDQIKEEFWSATRQIYKRIQDFYQAQRAEQEQNLLKKQALLEAMRGLSTEWPHTHKHWNKVTEEVKQMQHDWKLIGRVPREHSKQLWRDFRKICDQFFEAKRNWYKTVNEEHDAHKQRKLALVEQAEAVKDSEDWKETSHLLIQLQKEWKQIGPAHQRDENKLWKRFRSACDHFFQRRKGNRSEQNAEQVENLGKKEALLQELANAPLPAEVGKALAQLKHYSEQWRQIGHVPIKDKDRVNKAYAKLMDEYYSKLNVDQSERAQLRFEERVEQIKESTNTAQLLRKEQDQIRSQITKLENEIIQLENNMGFFANSKGAEKLKLEVTRKIDKVRADRDTLKQRLALLRDV